MEQCSTVSVRNSQKVHAMLWHALFFDCQTDSVSANLALSKVASIHRLGFRYNIRHHFVEQLMYTPNILTSQQLTIVSSSN